MNDAIIEKPALLPVHFDVPEHYFDAKDYLKLLKSFDDSLTAINNSLFNGELNCHLLVYRNDDGSFKTFLAVLATVWTLYSIEDSNLVSGFIKGLTGYEIDYSEIGEEAGLWLRDIIKAIYEKTLDELLEIIPKEINLDGAIKAKSDFYKMCLGNVKIKGVGFDDSEGFSIKRNRFTSHISKDRIRNLDSEFTLHDVVITSSVNVNNVDNQWKLRDVESKKKISAYMRDGEFKDKFLNGFYPLKKSNNDDLLKVLIEQKWEMKNGEKTKVEQCIHSVYEFNGEFIKEIPEWVEKGRVCKKPDERPMDNLWS